MDAYVCNMSHGGLALEGPFVDAEGTECELVLALPGHDAFEIQGRIIWSDASIPCMGFCYQGLSRDQRVALTNFLLARIYNG